MDINNDKYVDPEELHSWIVKSFKLVLLYIFYYWYYVAIIKKLYKNIFFPKYHWKNNTLFLVFGCLLLLNMVNKT